MEGRWLHPFWTPPSADGVPCWVSKMTALSCPSAPSRCDRGLVDIAGREVRKGQVALVTFTRAFRCHGVCRCAADSLKSGSVAVESV